ncbi:hypothetical protein [Pectobacterium brasiliense]|uniref:hypothetical protein n=1 Tax=Pectobacterium brasiliense TaxID=180957 RepID=UPI0019D3A783|nr:hypothetical protein [Pectobacterium brasiliense]MBN7767337.1 hypothetical protein [Pectobacterium brasiliense]
MFALHTSTSKSRYIPIQQTLAFLYIVLVAKIDTFSQLKWALTQSVGSLRPPQSQPVENRQQSTKPAFMRFYGNISKLISIVEQFESI